MELSIPQLCLMRSLRRVGSPPDLLEIFLSRCGATAADYQALLATGLVEQQKKTRRVVLTAAGQRAYNKQSKGRYF